MRKEEGAAQAADNAVGHRQDDEGSVSRARKKKQLGGAHVVARIGKGVN